MTFEEFQNTAELIALSDAPGHVQESFEAYDDDQRPARVWMYADETWIAVKPDNTFWLFVERSEHNSTDRAELEKILFGWLFGEGCFSADGEPEPFETETEAAAEKPAHDINTKIRLAREFGALVQEELSPAEFRALCDENKASGGNQCHLCDHRDGNMIMLEAFQKTFGRDPSFLVNGMDDETDVELFNDARTIAAAADYFA